MTRRLVGIMVAGGLLASLAGLLAAADRKEGRAKEPAPSAASEPSPANFAGELLVVEVEIRHEGMEAKARIITTNGVQSNFVRKSPKSGQTLLVNLLPAIVPDEEAVSMQFQVELSELKKDGNTLQIQNEYHFVFGKEEVLAKTEESSLKIRVRRVE